MEREGEETRLIEDFPWDAVAFHLFFIFSNLVPCNQKHWNGEMDWAISSLPGAAGESRSLRSFTLEGGFCYRKQPHGWGWTR